MERIAYFWIISNEEIKMIEKCVMWFAHQDSVAWISERRAFCPWNEILILKELPLYDNKSDKQIKKETYGILVVFLNDVTMVQTSRNIVVTVSDDTLGFVSVVYACGECGYRCAFIVPKAFHFVCERIVSRAYEWGTYPRHDEAKAWDAWIGFEAKF